MDGGQRGSPVGPIPCCEGVFCLCPTSSLLRRHGKGHGRLNCTGSGLFPMGLGILEGGVSAGSAGNSFQVLLAPSPLHEPFTGSILKRIPRSARVQGAAVLGRCVREVLKHPNDTGTWVRFFLFPTCFDKPIRGGARSNLTSNILAQLRLFDKVV